MPWPSWASSWPLMKQWGDKSTNRLVVENLPLTKEMLAESRRQKRTHPPIHFSGPEVGKVNDFKVLSAQISEDLFTPACSQASTGASSRAWGCAASRCGTGISPESMRVINMGQHFAGHLPCLPSRTSTAETGSIVHTAPSRTLVTHHTDCCPCHRHADAIGACLHTQKSLKEGFRHKTINAPCSTCTVTITGTFCQP